MEQQFLRSCEEAFPFTYSQLKQFIDMASDLRMWQEGDFTALFAAVRDEVMQSYPRSPRKQQADAIHVALSKRFAGIRQTPAVYPKERIRQSLPTFDIVERESRGELMRTCNAASDKTVCCGLKVINVVENCALGCTYCVLQNTFDEQKIVFPTNFKERLDQVVLDPKETYRIGTGEYSDSLLWGNRNNILGDLCDFADKHRNAVVELKTKSTNISYLLEREIPSNIVCSWSLNAPTIVEHEELRTPNLDARLAAARKIADKGLRVGFHFHPLIYFDDFAAEYQALAERVMVEFAPQEIAWISFGCLTLLPGFAKTYRKTYASSRLLKMELERTADNKLTYPLELRRELYQAAATPFKAWRGQTFFYLCMEYEVLFREILGHSYPNMAAMNTAMNDFVFPRLPTERYC